jgi:predicted HD superfamily hydrolase involved in NAD metabolism
MAEHDYGIDDEAVLRAIRLHSTGEAGMSQLEKIIFLADYTEPMRKFSGLKELRALAERDLDRAFRRALDMKFGHVEGQGRPLHPRSKRAFMATET